MTALICLLLSLSGDSVGQDPDSTGAIRILVIDQDSRIPLDNAVVYLRGTPFCCSTDSSGIALAAGVPLGTYRLQGQCPGYVRQYRLPPVNTEVIAGDTTDSVIELSWCPHSEMVILVGDGPHFRPDTLVAQISEWHIPDCISHTDSSITLAPVQTQSDDNTFSYLSDGYVTLLAFYHAPQQIITWQLLWDGELELSWRQSEPTVPRCTSVSVQVRKAGPDCQGYGLWSDWTDSIPEINASNMLDSAYAVQVRLHLHTDDPSYTPVVTEVRMVRSFIE